MARTIGHILVFLDTYVHMRNKVPAVAQLNTTDNIYMSEWETYSQIIKIKILLFLFHLVKN